MPATPTTVENATYGTPVVVTVKRSTWKHTDVRDRGSLVDEVLHIPGFISGMTSVAGVSVTFESGGVNFIYRPHQVELIEHPARYLMVEAQKVANNREESLSARAGWATISPEMRKVLAREADEAAAAAIYWSQQLEG